MVKSFKTNLLEWLKTKVYLKNEIDNKLNGKSDSDHTHANASTTNAGFLSAEDKTKLNNLQQLTVDSTISATSTNPVQNKVINTALTGKANSSHTHTITNITNLQSKLDEKANSVHTHDDRYYTETEMDVKLSDKANSSHTHTISQISDLTISANTIASNTYLTKLGKLAIFSWWSNTLTVPTANKWVDIWTLPVTNKGKSVWSSNIYNGADTLFFRVNENSNKVQVFSNKTGSIPIYSGQLIFFTG